MKKTLLAILIALSAPATFAANVNNNFNSSATLSSNCTLSTTDIAFGQLQLNGVRNYANGSINVLCTNRTTYSIAITYSKPDATQPQDGDLVGQNNGDLIDYAITSTDKGQYTWGVQGPVTGIGTGFLQSYVTYGVAVTGLYGKNAYPVPDTYSSSVTVTLNY